MFVTKKQLQNDIDALKWQISNKQVAVKRKDPKRVFSGHPCGGSWLDEYMFVEPIQAIEMLIAYLGLEYEDGTVNKAKLVKKGED